MTPQILSVLSAIFGLIGGIILAISLNKVIDEIDSAIGFLSISVESMAYRGDKFIFGGLDKNIKKAKQIAGMWVRCGIYCLAGSAIFASLSILLT